MDTKDPKETENNVTSIADKKPKGKVSKQDMINAIIAAIDKETSAKMTTGVIEERFELIPEPRGTGVQAIIVDEKGECVLLTKDHAVDILLHFVKSRVQKGWPITSAICLEAFTQWKAIRRKKVIKTPIKQVSFHSQDDLCWKKLDFDPAENPTPIFDEIMSRMTSPDEFKAFIGSLFHEEADRSQFFWIHGSGANGKSRLIAFLQNIFGESCTPQVAPTQATERWFKSGLVGKRLAVFGDCSNTKFVGSDLFKNLTGDDVHSVERKGIAVQNEIIRSKFLFMSNDLPSVVGDKAGRRRALVAEIGPVRGERVSPMVYDQKLRNEASGIIYACLRAYEELTEHHSEIRIGETMAQGIEEAVAIHDQESETILSKYFTVDHKSDQKHWVTARKLEDTLREEGLSFREKVMLRKYLTTLNVRSKTLKENGRVLRRYTGLVVNTRESVGAQVVPGATGAGVSMDF